MEKAINELKGTVPRIEGTILESYHPASSILHLADEIDADLIVEGTHSWHGLKKMILGSCAEEVIRHAKCPVLTIGPKSKPAPSEGFSFECILFATDLRHHTAGESRRRSGLRPGQHRKDIYVSCDR